MQFLVLGCELHPLLLLLLCSGCSTRVPIIPKKGVYYVSIPLDCPQLIDLTEDSCMKDTCGVCLDIAINVYIRCLPTGDCRDFFLIGP